MKIQKFLIWIQSTLMNYPDISFTTIKLFIQEFRNCLSKRELHSFNNLVLLQAINELTLKQISIDTTISNIKIKSLDNELNNIKMTDTD